MDKDLEHNMSALVAYSHTERYRTLWSELQDIQYLSDRSQIFLDIFNTFKNELENPTDNKIAELIDLMTKREFFISLINQGISTTINSIAQVLKLKNEMKETIPFPKFEITDIEYEAFFQKAKEAYMESDTYHEKRQTMGIDYAVHYFYTQWSVLGEVFNRTLAKDYVEALHSRNVDDIPVNYKHTMSGEKYFKSSQKAIEYVTLKRSY